MKWSIVIGDTIYSMHMDYFPREEDLILFSVAERYSDSPPIEEELDLEDLDALIGMAQKAREEWFRRKETKAE